jgi:hypothetical protein
MSYDSTWKPGPRLFALALLALVGCEGASAPVGADGGEPCEPGTANCECARGDVCGATEDGEMLLCQEGLCVGARCVAGSLACVCRGGDECDGELECRSGVCRSGECAAGELGCECLAGTCGADLYCDRALGGGTCVDGTGYPGGPCPEMGLCRDTSRCDAELDICVPCSPGSQGCVPDGGRCNAGLVLGAGRCLPPEPGAPKSPQCYTPCRGDLIGEDGSVRRCGVDGLMKGCVGDLVCADGSCVPEGSAPPSCGADTDCPGRQRCLAGGCYYDCERDTDCAVGRVCYQHACRVPCTWPTTADTVCPDGTACDSPSGIGGVCMPISAADPEVEEHTEVAASFALDVETLVLGEGSGSFQLTHDAPGREAFTVKRISHRAYDRDGELIEEVDASTGGAPLGWLELRYGSKSAPAGDLAIVVEPGCEVTACPAVEVRSVEPPSEGWTRWEGTLRVEHPTLGSRDVTLTWARGLDGRWAGTMYYFASFGDGGVAEWSADHRDIATHVENALIQRWAAFRSGRMMGGFHEMQAVLTATSEGSWAWPTTREACGSAQGACYLFEGVPNGIVSYVDIEEQYPIPTGVTELPLVVNLRSEGDHVTMRGRIESASALHFAGDPSFEITFAGDPSTCASSVSTDCVAFVDTMWSESAIGGRYLPGASGCAAGYQRLDIPWLVTGFREGTITDATGAASRAECREARLPFGDAEAARNGSLAGANPRPDGLPLCRTLSALDGALIDQGTLFVLFEERFHSCSDPDDPGASAAYGYMLLDRQPDALMGEDFQGSEMPASIDARTSMLGVQCDPELVEEVLGAPVTLDGTADTADVAMQLATSLRTGRDAQSDATDLTPHYYCQDTGLIDGGPYDDGSAGAWRVACPASSNVTYFVFTDGASLTPAEIAALPCQASYDAATQTRGSCGQTVEAWATSGRIETELVWACVDGSYCTTNRVDLLEDKVFYLPGAALFLPLDVAVEEAFRYKTRFQTRDGESIGFAPVICDPGSDLTPYCYDPEEIERLRARVDCLNAIYLAYGESATGAPMDELRKALSQSFGARQVYDWAGAPHLVEGFERLYAELMIMLADDAVTNAYRSRFDSAATVGASFAGSRFEPDGIDLTGVAGFELYSLYQATEYYQLALDRLYGLTPVISAALARGDAGDAVNDVVTPGTVTYYLERLVRGAAQKSRAWAEVAKRYHDLHRAELARTVLERAYTGSYLESVAIAQLMKSIAEQTGASNAAQMELALEDAMRSYRVAMTDMRQTHETLTDDVTYFGFPADYVPFPVRTQADFLAGNAFEDILRTTTEFLNDARNQEEVAISSSRAFDTDSASFQAELVRLQRSYEDRVAPICGYFTGDDGRTYPAITAYAHRSEQTALMGDPCGRTGNGEIYDQMLRIQQLASQRQLLSARYTHIQEGMKDEAERVDRQCGLIEGLADFEYKQGEKVLNLQDRVRDLNLTMSSLDRMLSAMGMVASTSAESFGGGAAVAAAYSATAVGANATIVGLQAKVNDTEHQIDQTQLETAHWRTEQQCDQIRIDSEVLMRSKLRDLDELQLEAEQLHLSIALADADLRRAMLEAQRIQQNLAEAEQLSINVEAARNDPNVRLYRNDAILNADRSFELAVQHAYRATRVFEYYSSQSYPDLDRLFQIRMVSRGEDNLDRYMAELRNDYLLLEEELHAPASRVERLSLMNDILGIPLLREDGTALSQSERERLLREKLTDPTMLDAEGRLSIPFHTSADELSPCTRNHKLNFIEVAIQGSGLGDDEANVSIWQEGTGVIESLGGGTQYYRLPAGLSVVQAYFGRNNTVFDPSVYRRYELNDRPYINTQWRMVIDQRHDRDNQDIDLNQITDVYLYLYYLDFTDPTGCGG